MFPAHRWGCQAAAAETCGGGQLCRKRTSQFSKVPENHLQIQTDGSRSWPFHLKMLEFSSFLGLNPAMIRTALDWAEQLSSSVHWLWRPTITTFCPLLEASLAPLCLYSRGSSSSSSLSCSFRTVKQSSSSSSSRGFSGFIRPNRKVKKLFNQWEPPSSTSSNQSRSSGSPWPSPSPLRPAQGGDGWMWGGGAEGKCAVKGWGWEP